MKLAFTQLTDMARMNAMTYILRSLLALTVLIGPGWCCCAIAEPKTQDASPSPEAEPCCCCHDEKPVCTLPSHDSGREHLPPCQCKKHEQERVAIRYDDAESATNVGKKCSATIALYLAPIFVEAVASDVPYLDRPLDQFDVSARALLCRQQRFNC
jgi:hypothetical protein